MDEYTFYYPDGTKIDDKKEFIKFYSRMYHYVDHNFKLETEMEKLLKRDSNIELNRDDIKNILLWKTSGQLIDDESIKLPRSDIEIKIDEVLDAYKEWKKKFRENICSEDDSCIAFIETLCEVDGIGRVIAITIMYYESCGKYPIYDRFADIAVRIIFNNDKFTKTLSARSLNTTAKSAQRIYNEYRENMETIFESCYKDTDRDIDRALWVYGHMFSKTKTNEKNKEGFKQFKEWRQT